jgi:hypothetical protein
MAQDVGSPSQISSMNDPTLINAHCNRQAIPARWMWPRAVER